MGNGNELLPGLVLPPAYHGTLRKRLAEIGVADSAGNCLIAQARAEGLVEAQETLIHGIVAKHIERLYVLIEDTTMARLAALQSDAGA